MQTLLMILGGVGFVALGAGLGYQLAVARERRAGGGKSASEIRQELESYQSSVSEHFMESATLLQGMTEQYKKVYEHMARGAQDLCDSSEDRPELEALRHGLLAAALASDVKVETDADGNVVEAEIGAGETAAEESSADADAAAGTADGAEGPDDEAGTESEVGETEPVATPVGEANAAADADADGETDGTATFDFGTPVAAGASEPGETEGADATTAAEPPASEAAEQTPADDDTDASEAAADGEDAASETAADDDEGTIMKAAGASGDDENDDGAATDSPATSSATVPGGQGWADRFRSANTK